MTSPDGDYWELYVSKTALPPWKGRAIDDDFGWDGTLLGLPTALAAAVWSSLVLPLGRVVMLLPPALVRGRRSRAVRIEAVKDFPRREVLLWTTTDGNLPRVLDEVAAGLSQGKIARPAGSVYTGPE